MQAYKRCDCFYSTITDLSGCNKDYVLNPKTLNLALCRASLLPSLLSADRVVDPIWGKSCASS